MKCPAAVAVSLALIGCEVRFRACENVPGRDYEGCMKREWDRDYLFPAPTPLPEIEEDDE